MGIGFDVTPASSVLVQLSKSGLTYKLGRTSIMPGYQHEADQPAARAANTDFGRALKSLPSNLRRGEPMVSMPGREVMYRVTGMGADNERAVRTLVRMEVEDLAGSTDMLSSYQRVYTAEGDPMLLIGVSRVAIIEHLQASLRSCDMRPEAFVPGPVALYQCHLMSGDLDYSGIQMIVNIGEECTDVVLVKGNDFLAARTLNFGVSSFVSEISQTIGVNSEQARETLFSRINMRPGVSGENVSGERSVSAAQDVAAKLYAQLNSAINFAKVQLSEPSLDVGKVAICGTGAAVQGMREFLMSRFRKTVEVLNPLAGVDTSGLNDPAIKQYQTALAIPLGLAKIACDGLERSIGFVAPSAIARKAFVSRTVWLYAGVITLVLALAYSLLISSGMVSEKQALAEKAKSRQRAYQSAHAQIENGQGPPNAPVEEQVARMAEINSQVMLTEQRAVELSAVQRPGISALALAMMLDRSAPIEVRVTGYSLTHANKEGQAQLKPRIEVNIYLERQDREESEAFIAFQENLRRNELVEASSMVPSDLADHPSGRGKTASITFTLKDTGAMFGVDAKKVAGSS